jgi:hypothetical protein
VLSMEKPVVENATRKGETEVKAVKVDLEDD